LKYASSQVVSEPTNEASADGDIAIGEVARRAGTRPSAIRYYERIGLLPTAKRVAGRRRYDGDVLRWLEMIALARRMGLTLAETRTLIWGFPAGTPPAERWGELARTKLADLEEQIRRLEGMQALLREALACRCSSLEECVARATNRP
jgi:MerR family transcriptional regulator, redox-sensitive transcriptional activator SoxR